MKNTFKDIPLDEFRRELNFNFNTGDITRKRIRSGVRGVGIFTNNRGYSYYRARVCSTDNGDRTESYKLFPHNEKGLDDATLWVTKKREELFGEYSGSA